MTGIQFTIPGKPFAWRRARSNGKIRFNDPAMTAHSNVVQAIALPLFPQPLDGAINLEIRACFKVPDSWSAKKKAAALWRPHVQKPDCDNLVKQIGDSLNRIAWVDDSQIAQITVRKIWGDRDHTIVVVETA